MMFLGVFSVDSGADLARSLPTTVPESPLTHEPRTPRTPRTPGRQDPNKTPRFYPVMKESGTIDGQVNSCCTMYLRGCERIQRIRFLMHENVFYLNSCIIYLLQVDRNKI